MICWDSELADFEILKRNRADEIIRKEETGSNKRRRQQTFTGPLHNLLSSSSIMPNTVSWNVVTSGY
jgi:hypothetical protein